MPQDNNQTAPDQVTTANTEPVQPSPSPNMVTTPPVATKQPNSRKKLVLMLVAALIVALAGVGALAYMVMNKPENVMGDALKHLLAAKQTTYKGQLVTETKGEDAGKFTVDFEGKAHVEQGNQATAKLSVDVAPVNMTFSGAMVTAKNGDTYLKVNDAKKILSTFAGDSPEIEQMLAPVIEKIDNKWVKATAKELADLSGGQTSDECTTKISNLTLSKADQDKIVSEFKKNMFVVIKETKPNENVNGKNSIHYVLGFDIKKAEAFGASLQNLESLKDVKDCFKDDQVVDTNETKEKVEKNPPVVELWIEQWSHKLTRAAVSYEDAEGKLRFTVDVDNDVPVTVEIPTTDITPLKDVQTELQKLFMPTATTLPTELDSELLLEQ